MAKGRRGKRSKQELRAIFAKGAYQKKNPSSSPSPPVTEERDRPFHFSIDKKKETEAQYIQANAALYKRISDIGRSGSSTYNPAKLTGYLHRLEGNTFIISQRRKPRASETGGRKVLNTEPAMGGFEKETKQWMPSGETVQTLRGRAIRKFSRIDKAALQEFTKQLRRDEKKKSGGFFKKFLFGSYEKPEREISAEAKEVWPNVRSELESEASYKVQSVKLADNQDKAKALKKALLIRRKNIIINDYKNQVDKYNTWLTSLGPAKAEKAKRPDERKFHTILKEYDEKIKEVDRKPLTEEITKTNPHSLMDTQRESWQRIAFGKKNRIGDGEDEEPTTPKYLFERFLGGQQTASIERLPASDRFIEENKRTGAFVTPAPSHTANVDIASSTKKKTPISKEFFGIKDATNISPRDKILLQLPIGEGLMTKSQTANLSELDRYDKNDVFLQNRLKKNVQGPRDTQERESLRSAVLGKAQLESTTRPLYDPKLIRGHEYYDKETKTYKSVPGLMQLDPDLYQKVFLGPFNRDNQAILEKAIIEARSRVEIPKPGEHSQVRMQPAFYTMKNIEKAKEDFRGRISHIEQMRDKLRTRIEEVRAKNPDHLKRSQTIAGKTVEFDTGAARLESLQDLINKNKEALQNIQQQESDIRSGARSSEYLKIAVPTHTLLPNRKIYRDESISQNKAPKFRGQVEIRDLARFGVEVPKELLSSDGRILVSRVSSTEMYKERERINRAHSIVTGFLRNYNAIVNEKMNEMYGLNELDKLDRELADSGVKPHYRNDLLNKEEYIVRRQPGPTDRWQRYASQKYGSAAQLAKQYGRQYANEKLPTWSTADRQTYSENYAQKFGLVPHAPSDYYTTNIRHGETLWNNAARAARDDLREKLRAEGLQQSLVYHQPKSADEIIANPFAKSPSQAIVQARTLASRKKQLNQSLSKLKVINKDLADSRKRRNKVEERYWKKRRQRERKEFEAYKKLPFYKKLGVKLKNEAKLWGGTQYNNG